MTGQVSPWQNSGSGGNDEFGPDMPMMAPQQPANGYLDRASSLRDKYAQEQQRSAEYLRNLIGGQMTAPIRTRQQKWGDAASFLVDRIALPLAGVMGGPGAAEGITQFMADADKNRKLKMEQDKAAKEMKWKAIDGYMNWREHMSKSQNNEVDQLLAMSKLQEAQRREAYLNDSRVLANNNLAQERATQAKLKELEIELKQRTMGDAVASAAAKRRGAEYDAEGKFANTTNKLIRNRYTEDTEKAKLEGLRSKNAAQTALASSRNSATARNQSAIAKNQASTRQINTKMFNSVLAAVPDEHKQEAANSYQALRQKIASASDLNGRDPDEIVARHILGKYKKDKVRMASNKKTSSTTEKKKAYSPFG